MNQKPDRAYTSGYIINSSFKGYRTGATMVTKRKKIIFEKGYGLANYEAGIA